MSEVYDLAVIGAGPAGMLAAISAGETGVSTVLIDHYPQPGGQYYKSLPAAYRAVQKTAEEIEGYALAGRLQALPITRLYGALTWGVFKRENDQGFQVTLYGENAPKQIFARQLVLANGAYDTPVAFPGWTLPGVITSGAALVLLKNQRTAPFRRVLATGTGPLLLSAAAHLAAAGVEIAGVCEVNRIRPKMLRHGLTLLKEWQRMLEGAGYIRALARGKASYKFGWTIVEAHGSEQVEEAVIARIDAHGIPIPGTQQVLQVDGVVCGYGLTPNTSLARMLGCRLEFNPLTHAWEPWRSETFETSVAGVYMVGDCAGIRGAHNARLEGQVAGIAAAHSSGRIRQPVVDRLLAKLKPGLRQQRRFGQVLGEFFSPMPGLISLSQDDTIVCRCEEIRLGEVKAAVAAGARTIGEVKMITRVGMGNCQGRMCEHSVAGAIVQQLANQQATPETVGFYSTRPPLHPLPIEFFANAGIEE